MKASPHRPAQNTLRSESVEQLTMPLVLNLHVGLGSRICSIVEAADDGGVSG
jgi:hypothetical protein